jgi:hypothetical protein
VCIRCILDPPATVRKTDIAKHPRTPMCATHRREWKREQREARTDKRAVNTYGLPPGHYAKLKEAQNGKCFICQHATGARKALANDHDHQLAMQHDHPVTNACEDCMRALLCSPCNQLIGRLGVAALLRAVLVLTDPPYQRMRRGLPIKWEPDEFRI